MNLPPEFEFVRASGWWSLYHLRHTACGWESRMCYDTCKDEDRTTIRQMVYGHECE